MSKNGYLTVDGETENQIIVERSKFICYLKNVTDDNDAKTYVDKIKKLHSSARHNCYAYIADEIGNAIKYSDDGEPQGTAGTPILEVLKGRGLFKVVAVVTRYFGGVKLGASRLTRTYAQAVKECIDVANIKYMLPAKFIQIETEYDGYSKLLKFVASNDNVFIVSTEYDNGVTLTLAIGQDNFDDTINKLTDFFNGKIEYTIIKEDYIATGENNV